MRYYVTLLVAALLMVTAQVAAQPATPAECGGLALRTFTEAERQQFETQYGVNWWKARGLIPGPETAADYVSRPFGDSTITVYMPQQFWDPRACADRPAAPANRPST